MLGCLNEHKRRKRAERGARPRPTRRYAAVLYEPDDEARITDLIAAGKTDNEIATVLGRTPGAISSFRFRKQISIPDEQKSAHIKTGLLAVGPGATDEEKSLIENHYPTQMSGELLARLPGRNGKWIRQQAQNQKIRSSTTKRNRVGQHAQSHVDHDKRLKLDVSVQFDDLSYIEQKVFRGGMLGDGGTYRYGKNRYCHYAETHAGKLSSRSQAEYVDWLGSLLRLELRSHLGDIGGGIKRQLATVSHPLFECLRSFYVTHSVIADEARIGHNSGASRLDYKCVIPDWLIETFDEIDLFFWYLGDGNAGNKKEKRPSPNISVPRWQRDCLDRLCETANAKHGWHLYLYLFVSPTSDRTELRLMIPAEDRDVLWPCWRKFGADRNLPKCMWYKLRPYEIAEFGGKKGGVPWEWRHPDRQALIPILKEMKEDGETRSHMSEYLRSQGHYLSTRNLTYFFERIRSMSV